MSLITTQHKLRREVKDNTIPSSLIRFARRVTEETNNCNQIVVNSRIPLPKSSTFRYGISPERGSECIINLTGLNDIRYVNKFLESVNEQLPPESFFAGSVETAQAREERILASIPSPLRKPYLFLDYVVNRVWPKLPYLKKLYFLVTNGHNRVMSEMETYGRLYSCGFRLVESKEINGRLHFIVQKVKEPEYNKEATYGPLIKLRRVGKNGKLVNVYKMRTMSPYSEYVQGLIYEWHGLGNGAKFKDDPRITPVGSFMRKYWIDELPMLYNLVRGDLKIFGVRPISPHYFSLYPQEFQEFRKQFKPGLIPPVYVEVPNSLEDTVDIERRYLEAYKKRPLLTDLRYTYQALYNILIKRVRSH
ncbi:MAG: sugar transferase [Saprospirales bacterium]|nr:sugar transferase [Saprospirales bacterium]